MITLIDEDNNEHTFEILDTLEYEDKEYYALYPVFDDAEESVEDSGEYYITDLVGLAVAEGRDVRGVQCGSDESLMGVNSPRELAQAEESMRAFVVEGLLDKGVLLHAPALVRVSPRATIEAGAELSGPCDVLGSCHVERGARIEAYCSLRDSHVASGAEIRPYCHLEQARVGEGALVGPYARLRPGS